MSIALAAAIALFVRETPHGTPRHEMPDWRSALIGVARNRATWPPFFVNVATSGAYMAFIGLWAAPYLIHAHAMTPVEASRHTAITLIVFAFTAAVVGGLDSPVGAMVGGVTTGLLLAIVTTYSQAADAPIAALVVLVLTLLLRPSGLFGTRSVRSV